MLQGLLLYAELYYISLYLSSLKDKSPIGTGVALLPLTIALVPAGIVTGLVITHTGHFRPTVWVGWAVGTLGSGLTILLDRSTKSSTDICVLIVLGLGQGLILTSLSSAIQAISDTKDVAYAMTMYAFMRTPGLALGVAIRGAIFQNRLVNELAGAGLSSDIAADAVGFLLVLKTLPPSQDALKDSVLFAYSKSYTFLFKITTGISASALLISFTIKHYALDRPLDSEHVLQNRSVDG